MIVYTYKLTLFFCGPLKTDLSARYSCNSKGWPHHGLCKHDRLLRHHGHACPCRRLKKAEVFTVWVESTLAMPWRLCLSYVKENFWGIQVCEKVSLVIFYKDAYLNIFLFMFLAMLCGTWGILVPQPGTEPVHPWKHGFLTTGPPWCTLNCVWLFATPPLSMGFLRQEYWSGLPFLSPGDLPNPGIELVSPA